MVPSLLKAIKAFNELPKPPAPDASSGSSELYTSQASAFPSSPSVSELALRLESVQLESPQSQEGYGMPGAFISISSSADAPATTPDTRTPTGMAVDAIAIKLAELHVDKSGWFFSPEKSAIVNDAQTTTVSPASSLSPTSNLYDIRAEDGKERLDSSMETYLTAATLTATPIDRTTHSKLFSSSAEFYQRSNHSLPDSLKSVQVSDVTEALTDIVRPKTPPITPAFQPSNHFGRKSTPTHLKLPKSPSPSLTPPSATSKHMGKGERDARQELDQIRTQLEFHTREVFSTHFSSLPVDDKHDKVGAANAFVKDSLSRLGRLGQNANRRTARQSRPRAVEDDGGLRQECEEVLEVIRNFSLQVCAEEAFLPESTRPYHVDADHLYDSKIAKMDQINQVLIVLAVICHMVVGLSVTQTNFMVGVAVMLVKLGMSTVGSAGSSCSPAFTYSQSEIIADMPTSLANALKKFNVEGNFHLYATCPSCSFTNRARPLAKEGTYDLPETCSNDIVGESGIYKCGVQLLKTRADGTKHPIKPYLVSSFNDYLARCLSDSTYLQQSLQATDVTFRAIKRGGKLTHMQDVFDAEFTRGFRGPDGSLFVDRGDKIRLGFSVHVDFLNPNGVRHRGATESIGVISCANLALDPSIRYLPEYMYVHIIPGPNEPSYDEIDHFVRPVVEQFVKAWRPGIKVSRTADPQSNETGAVVEAGILLSVNDLPAARKVAGLQGPMSALICSVCRLRGRDQVFNTDHSLWIPRDPQELRSQANEWKKAKTIKEREAIFDAHGVRWSSLWLLDYWDPTRMLVVDAMHCVLEGLVHYHCRHVLRLDAHAPEITGDGFKYAFDRQWIEYDNDFERAGFKVEEKHIQSVGKIHQTLSLALEGEKSSTLDQVWTRLDNQSYLDSLKFVVHTLNITLSLNGLHEEVSTLYAQRAKKKSKSRSPKGFNFYSEQPSRKNHFIALLLNWRLSQPFKWNSSLTKTGSPETLSHVQRVIRETVTPSWLDSVPKNYGELKAGTIKADEWRTLSSVYLPIALVTLWGDDNGCVPPSDHTDPGLLFRALDHTMALFQATIICCRHTMTEPRAQAYRDCLDTWIKDLRSIYPHVREGVPRTIVHAAGHIFQFLMSYGPVNSWWCFPYERLIGSLQKINTNNHIGGMAESTMMKTIARTANIRRWLRRPDCPTAIKQLKVIFDKSFVPANATTESKPLQEIKGSRRAYAKHDGHNFSGSMTHEGNASIIYRPTSTDSPRAGQIKWIENVKTPDGDAALLHVRPYQSLSKAVYDPFVRYPHLDAKTYSSTLADTEHVIQLEDVVAHAARFDYSQGRSVFLNLSRD